VKLSDLPSIDFVDVDTATVEKAVLECYTNITGRTLAKADPIRLFLLFVADVIVQIMNKVNDTGKQNLLKYARGDNLDHLAALLHVERIASSPAVTTMQVTLSAARETETIVPAGTRIATSDKLYFATDKALVIAPGQTTGQVAATCQTTGTAGNNYKVGEISDIVDPVPYVQAITNITKSAGGAETETDDALRERVFEAPESFSAAGPAGAYEFWAKSANSAIDDVEAFTPEPGVVQVTPLLAGGTIPESELLKEVEKKLSANDIRPLTDNVKVVAPTAVPYEVDVSYYIDTDADAAAVQTSVSSAVKSYVEWQRAKLGRDIVPSRLVQYIMAVSGVKRVDVKQPTFIPVNHVQVAQERKVAVTMVGSEDE